MSLGHVEQQLLTHLESVTKYMLCIDWFQSPPKPCGTCLLCRVKDAINEAKERSMKQPCPHEDQECEDCPRHFDDCDGREQ